MSASLRVGLLGLGYFAQFHQDAWARIEGADLVATADAAPDKQATYPDLDSLLAENLDIVDIATPPPSHAEAVEKALAAKPRAIICQKPFCTSLEEAERVAALAEAAGVPLFVHENFRFQPWFRTMKAALDAGQIGRPLNLTFRLRTGDGQGDDAYLARQPYFQTMPRLLIHETGVHYIDTFRYLLGEPAGVYADLRRLNPVIRGEDAGHVIFDYASGCRAVLDGNRLLDFAADNTRRTFGEALLEGTEGTLTLTGDGTVTLRKFGEVEGRTLLAGRDWPGFAGDCVLALQQHVVDAVHGACEAENLATDYLHVLRQSETIYASAAAKAWLPIQP